MQEKAAEKKERWTMFVVISSALMAVCAALASSLAGHHSDEALISQIKASDQWSLYQAKSIKAEILSNIQSLNKSTEGLPEEARKKLEKYDKEKEQIMEQATDLEKESSLHLVKHLAFARAVTLFQVSIAISAISMLSGKKFLWMFSLVLAGIGIAFSLGGLL
jgi:hypothetical protein